MTHQSRPPDPNQVYLSRRESQERVAADQSTDPAVRRIHAALAQKYAEQLEATMPVAG